MTTPKEPKLQEPAIRKYEEYFKTMKKQIADLEERVKKLENKK